MTIYSAAARPYDDIYGEFCRVPPVTLPPDLVDGRVARIMAHFRRSVKKAPVHIQTRAKPGGLRPGFWTWGLMTTE